MLLYHKVNPFALALTFTDETANNNTNDMIYIADTRPQSIILHTYKQ